MSKRVLSFLSIIALLIAFSMTLSAQEEAGGGGTLIGGFDVGPGGAPQVIPFMDTAGRTWLSKLYSPLVLYSADMTAVEPELATDWSSNEDNTVWTINLREGVLWHDGEAFTADDVVFSLNMALNPDAGTSFSAYSGITNENFVEARAIDDFTIEFEMAVPTPRLPFSLAFVWILPEHALADLNPAEYTTTDWFFTTPVGTGPFMHDEFEADQFWALVPNPTYWRGAPQLDRLINRYFADQTAAVLALESGEIQFTYVDGDVALQLGEEAGFELYDGPSGVTNYYMFNYRNPIFQDIRVRQAFLYGLDRELITETVLEGTAEVVPCIIPFPAAWPAAEELNDYAYNPELASELLAEAGVTIDMLEVVTYYNSQFHNDAQAAQQQFLSTAGINIVPLAQDVPTYNSYFYTGEGWDVTYRGIGFTIANFPYGFYEVGGWETTDGLPLMGEIFPELDALMQAARVEADPDVYISLMQDICLYQNQNAIEGYMWTARRFGVASDNVQDFYWFPAAGGGPYLDNAHLWSVND